MWILKNGFIRLWPEDTKTQYGRSIPIHPEVMEVLKKASKVRSLENGRGVGLGKLRYELVQIHIRRGTLLTKLNNY